QIGVIVHVPREGGRAARRGAGGGARRLAGRGAGTLRAGRRAPVVPAAAIDRQEFRDDRGAGGGAPDRLEHHRARQIAAGEHLAVRAAQRPVAVRIVPEQRAEQRIGGEAGHAQPGDGPGAGHERRGAPVREQGVVFDERAPQVRQVITAAPSKSNIAWFSQAFPELGSSGSQPAPSTAVQAGSQYTTPRPRRPSAATVTSWTARKKAACPSGVGGYPSGRSVSASTMLGNG